MHYPHNSAQLLTNIYGYSLQGNSLFTQRKQPFRSSPRPHNTFAKGLPRRQQGGGGMHHLGYFNSFHVNGKYLESTAADSAEDGVAICTVIFFQRASIYKGNYLMLINIQTLLCSCHKFHGHARSSTVEVIFLNLCIQLFTFEKCVFFN